MFKVRFVVLLAAVVAVFAVSAGPAMAFKAFLAKPAKGQVKGKTVGTQTFGTKFGNVECKTAEASGTTTVEKGTTQELVFKYPTGSCLALGFVPTKITEEKYTFNVSGEVTLNNEVKVELSNCTLLVSSGQKFAAPAVVYENSGNNLKGFAKTEGVKYKGKGSLCEGEAANGTYKGQELLESNTTGGVLNVEP